MKLEPIPGRLSTSIEPPWALTTCWQIESPSPSPTPTPILRLEPRREAPAPAKKGELGGRGG